MIIQILTNIDHKQHNYTFFTPTLLYIITELSPEYIIKLAEVDKCNKA